MAMEAPSRVTPRTIIESLVRARKATRLYPAEHSVNRTAVQDLQGHVSSLLDTQDALTYAITNETILYEGAEVYRAESMEGNLAAFFHHEGVRELVFKKGVTQEELRRFVGIIAVVRPGAALGDDLVTRLWSDEFPHIRCISFDPCLIDDPGLAPMLSEEEIAAIMSGALRSAPSETPARSLPDAIDLDDGELIGLKTDRGQNSADRTNKLLSVIFEVLLLAEKDNEFLEIEKAMLDAVDFALERDKMDVLARFFSTLKDTYLDSLTGYYYRASLSRIFGYLSSERFLSAVGRRMDEGLRIDPETVGTITRLLDRNAIPVLIDLLGHLETISARKAVVTMLGSIGGEDLPALTRAINDERWYVVRNVVVALRMIGDRQAKYYLLKCLHHRDSRVRREALKAFAETEREAAISILRDALDDADGTVRVTALGILSQMAVPAAKSTLLRRILSDEFPRRDYEEKKEYLGALVRYDDADVLEILREFLGREGILGSINADETAAAAVYSLGLRGKRDALPFLTPLRDAKSALVRDAAVDAIRKIEHGA